MATCLLLCGLDTEGYQAVILVRIRGFASDTFVIYQTKHTHGTQVEYYTDASHFNITASVAIMSYEQYSINIEYFKDYSKFFCVIYSFIFSIKNLFHLREIAYLPIKVHFFQNENQFHLGLFDFPPSKLIFFYMKLNILKVRVNFR